jgi:hypothetical protein
VDVQLRFPVARPATIRCATRLRSIVWSDDSSNSTVTGNFARSRPGCGWGRIIRFFLRDIEPGQLMGIDCLPLAIEICQQSDPATRFSLVNALPPTTLASESFDLIHAYSVFSHRPKMPIVRGSRNSVAHSSRRGCSSSRRDRAISC